MIGRDTNVLVRYIMQDDPVQSPKAPDGHFKFPHLWPVKFPQAGRPNYQSFGLTESGLLSW